MTELLRYAHQSFLTFTNTDITDNKARNAGGGAYLSNSVTVFQDGAKRAWQSGTCGVGGLNCGCTISGNTADDYNGMLGGGLYLVAQYGSSPTPGPINMGGSVTTTTLQETYITSNGAGTQGYGGGIYSSEGPMILKASDVHTNTAGSGGADFYFAGGTDQSLTCSACLDTNDVCSDKGDAIPTIATGKDGTSVIPSTTGCYHCDTCSITYVPTGKPTQEPTLYPTSLPTLQPTHVPTPKPSMEPTPAPTHQPTRVPTPKPTTEPTPVPTTGPTHVPTALPTEFPAPDPTLRPTPKPTQEPSLNPSPKPTTKPSPLPTSNPTPVPSSQPTPLPSPKPTAKPTFAPTFLPTPKPTFEPSPVPTSQPTHVPTPKPSSEPSPVPTYDPTHVPTALPSPRPSAQPTPAPSNKPSPVPSPQIGRAHV